MFLIDQRLQNFTRLDAPCSFLTVHPSHRDWVADFPEGAEIRWVCETYGDPDAIAVDVGAHCGTWTTQLSGAFAEVVAFEPNRLVYWNLCANLALRRCLNTEPVELAVSSDDRDSVTYVVRSEDGGGNGIEIFEKDGSSETRQVRATRLDTFFASRPSRRRVALVKIDVEGHELAVLQGARGLLQRDRPVLVLESWEDFREQTERVPARKLREDLFRFVREELRYEIHSVTCNAGMFLATPLEPARSSPA